MSFLINGVFLKNKNNMTKEDFICNYMNKQLKKNKLPYGIQYFSWLADKEEKAERLYKKYLKK
jgi:poly(3-hydroxyalkanoate) synthetase